MNDEMTAATALAEGREEIVAGYWCKNDLARLGTSDGEPVATDSFRPDREIVPIDDFEPAERPMGCALGIISMRFGLGQTFKVDTGKAKVDLFVPAWPSERFGQDTKLSEAGETGVALAALAAVAIEETIEETMDWSMSAAERSIYRFNDSEQTDQSVAAGWFERARQMVATA